MSIAVFGGNGFLGRKICEYGIKNGYQVTSFSKSGIPPLVTNEWLNKVKWESANVFEDASYKTKLSQFDTVFHSMGKIFHDESYKTNLNGSRIDLKFLKNVIMGANPMNKTTYNSMEAVNKLSALKLANACLKANKQSKLVYISADKGLPVVTGDYIRTKREAEMALMHSKLNTLIIRPGIMYDTQEQNNRYHLLQGLQKVHDAKEAVLGKSLDCANATIRPILSTDKVCAAIFANLHRDNAIVTLEDIMGSS